MTREHARKVQEVFAHLPTNATKRFPGMTLVQAAQHAEKSGLPPISAKTAEVQLGNFSSFFSWAVREHLIDRTPAAGLQPLQEKRSKEDGRQPFSDADLVKLFSADLFREPYPRLAPKLLGRYWVPLLALYHGARMNELCQLEVADAGVADGIPFLHIREESAADEEKHLKTRNSERIVPVHPVLQQLGFVEYVEATRDAGHVRLFPTLTKSATGYYSDNFSKWFGRFCDKCGVTDSRLAFHSFRHGFRDAARAADVPSEVAREFGRLVRRRRLHQRGLRQGLHPEPEGCRACQDSLSRRRKDTASTGGKRETSRWIDREHGDTPAERGQRTHPHA